MYAFALAILMVLASLPSGASGAEEYVDAVITKDGLRFTGVIIERVPNERITLRTPDGRELVFTFDRIERITRERAVDPDRIDMASWSYPELAVSIGTPAGINWTAGHWFGAMGVRFSGGYLKGNEPEEKMWGVQLNLIRKLYDTPRSRHTIALLVASSEIVTVKTPSLFGSTVRTVETNKLNCVGLVYGYNWRGLVLEAGLSVGSNDGYGPVQALLQVGYMYRFWRMSPQRGG